MRKFGRPIKHGDKWRIRPTGPNGKRLSLIFESKDVAELELRQRELDFERSKLGLSPKTDVTAPDSLSAMLKHLHGMRKPIVPGKSFDDLCAYWIANRVPQKRSGDDDESILRAHLKPAFGGLLLCSIGIEHVDDFKIRRKHLDKQTTNNHLKLLITMLNVAVELKWLDERLKIKKFKVPKYSKDFRYLKVREEIARFLIAAREEGEYAFALYSTAIYTGLRLGELAALEKASVDFERRLIMVKSSFLTATKSEEIRFVPILDPLLPVLKSWFLQCPGVLVFPNARGNMHQPSARVFQETLHRVLTAAGFPKVQFKGKERHYIRFHDLRHTFASHWVMAGGCIFRLQKILGHQSPEMTQRYAHLSPDVFSSDYGRMGTAAPGIEPGTVLNFKMDDKIN